MKGSHMEIAGISEWAWRTRNIHDEKVWISKQIMIKGLRSWREVICNIV
jgi:hypothetical protein